MRTQSVDAILNMVSQATPSSTAEGNDVFSPMVDGITVFSDYPALSAKGNFIKAPLLIGNNDNESGLFALVDALSGITFPPSYWDTIDQSYTCGSGVKANYTIAAAVPTWRYLYFGDFPNLRISPATGAWHGSELPLLFDNAPTGSGIPAATTAEAIIAMYLRGAWAAFAKDPAAGLKTYGWPEYSPAAETLVRLAYNNEIGTNLASSSLYDAGC
jgi:carboxylesterase type B